MLSSGDQAYLLRQLSNNRVVLFLGAGFSTGAKNSLGENLPIGSKLAEDLWEFLGYESPFDGTDLPTLYEAALGSDRGHAALKMFLEERLVCAEIPGWYESITIPYWYRIYTTNVDNLLESVYRRAEAAPKLTRFVAPDDFLRERDQYLESLQLIKLNGSLNGHIEFGPSDITFSIRQYSKRSSDFDLFYYHFVRDYWTRPTILIGSDLGEPLFWQQLTRRESRAKEGEERPKSFVVVPNVSPPKRDVLEDLNVVPVEATIREFCEMLKSLRNSLPNRIETLQSVAPDLAIVASESSSMPDRDSETALKLFFESFSRVQPVEPPDHLRPVYLGHLRFHGPAVHYLWSYGTGLHE